MKLTSVVVVLATLSTTCHAGEYGGPVIDIDPWEMEPEEVSDNDLGDDLGVLVPGRMEEGDHWIESAEDYFFNLHGHSDHIHSHPYFQRDLELDNTGNIVPPTTSELAELLLREFDHEKQVNGTVDPAEAMARVAEQILAHAAKDGTEDNSTVEALTEKLTIPDGSPELLMIDEAAIQGTNHSLCAIPGKCMTHEKMILVKNFIKNMLNHCILTNTEVDLDKMYQDIEQELEVDPDLADKLIEASPKIRKYLKTKMRKTERLVKKKEFSPIAKVVETVLLDAGNNMTEFDDAIADLDLNEEEIASVLLTMGKTRSDKVLEAMKKPEKDLEAQIQKALEDEQKARELDEHKHEYYEDLGEVDEDGRRVLRFVPHPNKMSMDDHIKEIDKEIDDRMHRRRLARASSNLPKDTSNFQRLLTDHIDELSGHFRELSVSDALCEPGSTNTRCMADTFEDLAVQLSTVGGKVTQKLLPLDTLLGKMDHGQQKIDDVEKLVQYVYMAVLTVIKVPKFGKGFKPLELLMRPVKNALTIVDRKATQFDKTVGKAWDLSIGTVETLISSFDSGAVKYIVSGAAGVAAIQESQCMSSLLNHVAGFNALGGVDDAMGLLKTYMTTLIDALQGLFNMLNSKEWKKIAGILEKILNTVEPIREFFAPFHPLEELMKEKVTLLWFQKPYRQKKFGSNQCDSGYSKHWIDKRHCEEKDSYHWSSYFSIPTRMKVTCRSGKLSSHWTGSCKNSGYGRKDCKIKIKCKCHCWGCVCPKCGAKCDKKGYKYAWWKPLRCAQDCKSGYVGVLNTCWKSKCPTNYKISLLKDTCRRTRTRSRKTRGTNCNKYNGRLNEGTSFTQNIFGECWQSCAKGETLILGFCFPESTLRVSIEDIFDSFEKLMKYIRGLPIVNKIEWFINKVVDEALKPIMWLLGKAMKFAVGLPLFPTINLDFLPFSDFKDISITMPTPDLSAITEAPQKFFQDTMKKLPAPMNGIAECASDVQCIAAKLDVNPGYIMDELTDLFNSFENFTEGFANITAGIKCVEWKEEIVKTSDVLAKLGLPDIDVCDTVLEYCNEVDYSGITDTLSNVGSAFQSVVTRFQNTTAGRRLAESDEEMWWPLMGFSLSSRLLGDTMSNQNGMEFNVLGLTGAQWVNGKFQIWDGTATYKQPVGIHFRLEPMVFFNFGLIVEKNTYKFGMELGSKTDFRFGKSVGASHLLKKAIHMAEEIGQFSTSNEYSACYDTDGSFEEFYFSVFAPTVACEHIQKATALIKKNPPPSGCSNGEMTILMDKFSGSSFRKNGPTHDQTKSTVKCVQHYFKVDKMIYDKKAKFAKARAKASDPYEGEEKRRMFDFLFRGKYKSTAGLLNFLKVRTDFMTRNLLGSKMPPVYRIGKDSVLDMIFFGLGLEVIDYVTLSKLGPYVQLGALGFKDDWSIEEAFQFWNFGEFSFTQFLKLLVWGVDAGAARAGMGGDNAMVIANRDHAKKSLDSALADIMYSTLVTVGVAGVIDGNWVIPTP